MKIQFTINVPNWLDLICVSPLLLYRLLTFGQPYRRIPLTQGQFALVDPEDYYDLMRFKWSASKWNDTFYAVRSQGKKQIKMHRWIMKPPPYLVVDHFDHNGINNTKTNLRICTQLENAANQKPRKNGSSIYKGVCWNKRDKIWDVRLRHNGKNLYIGSFHNELDAAHAYDCAAKKYKGKFAQLNFPERSEAPSVLICAAERSKSAGGLLEFPPYVIFPPSRMTGLTKWLNPRFTHRSFGGFVRRR